MEANNANEKLNGKTSPDKKPEYQPPKGAKTEAGINIAGKSLKYVAESDWIILHKDEKPRAEMLYTRYFLLDEKGKHDTERPITFIFNGGPGASSVYLHIGAIGPRRADFGPMGEPLPPPHKLVDNAETWLPFTDLVFVDPIGTGISRVIPDEKADEKAAESKKDVEYWELQKDLESIGEFGRKFLTRFNRWESPVYLAGESYGGFRVAKLARVFQMNYGIALSGAIILSPALEFTLLDGSDYDTMMWLDTFPTMAAAAFWHKKGRKARDGDDHRSYARRAGEFAVRELLPVLAAGNLYGEDKKNRVLDIAADWIGLPRAVMRAKNGRVTIHWFVKNLLRSEGKFLGLYDASFTVSDPYPDRDEWAGPDPTLHISERVFASGINTQIRHAIGLETDREYSLLSGEVNQNWKNNARKHVLRSQTGATDDLRYGMSINPDMKVFLCHGYFDLVTPFFSADRIANLMKLDEARREKLTLKHYDGGHMFYVWKNSREELVKDMEAFYRKK